MEEETYKKRNIQMKKKHREKIYTKKRKTHTRYIYGVGLTKKKEI